jgi:hypothetical protein
MGVALIEAATQAAGAEALPAGVEAGAEALPVAASRC